MKRQLLSLGLAALAAAGAAGSAVGTAAANTPDISTWTNHAVDPGYFDCDGVPITGDWMVSHHLIIFFDASGTPVRDVEKIEFTGAFVNPATGASIVDSGQAIFFDTLAPDYSFLTTTMNTVRHSAYFHAAGRVDFQSGATMGMDNWDSGFDAACEVLGA